MIISPSHHVLPMSNTVFPAIQVLGTSVVEIFRTYRDGFPVGDFLAYRTGPDRLHPATFRRSFSPILWVAYWYRTHMWCAGDRGGCNCAEFPRHGEGLCIIAFTDQTFGYYEVAPTCMDDDAFSEMLAEPHSHLSLDQLFALRGQFPPSRHVLAVAPPSPAALQGVWAAFDVAMGTSAEEISGPHLA